MHPVDLGQIPGAVVVDLAAAGRIDHNMARAYEPVSAVYLKNPLAGEHIQDLPVPAPLRSAGMQMFILGKLIVTAAVNTEPPVSFITVVV